MLTSMWAKVAAVILLSVVIFRRYGSWPMAIGFAVAAVVFFTYRDRQQVKGSSRTSLKLNE